MALGSWADHIFLPGFQRSRSDTLDTTLEEEKPPANWIKSLDLRGWSGYKDNILLENRNIVSSPLVAGSSDFTLFRLPVDGWECVFLTSAEYVRYLSSSEVTHEATVIAQAKRRRHLGMAGRSGSPGIPFLRPGLR